MKTARVISSTVLLIGFFACNSCSALKDNNANPPLNTIGRASTFTDSIIIPFLGALPAQSEMRELASRGKDGGLESLPFTVWRLSNGRFIAAEFTRPGATRYWNTPAVEESEHRAIGEEITGVPLQDGMPMLPMIMQRLREAVDWHKATHIDVKFVMLRGVNGRAERPAFITTVYGVKRLEGTPLPNEERFKVVRYVFDPKGSLLYSSN
jgi:hypothetical protein